MPAMKTESFLERTHFEKVVPEQAEYYQRLNRMGAVYYHALAMIRKGDPYAVEPIEAPETLPQLIRKFFRYNEALEDEGDIRHFNLKPDLLAIDYVENELRFHEIEDTSPLRPEKLRRYIRLFEYADADGLCIRLYVYDRYGLSRRELDLPTLSIITSGFYTP